MNKLTKYALWAVAVLLIIIALVTYSMFAAEFLDEGSYLTTKTIKPDSAVRLQTTGEDLRIYEYTPVTMPWMQCVLVAGTNKGDNDCFQKREYVLNPQNSTRTPNTSLP